MISPIWTWPWMGPMRWMPSCSLSKAPAGHCYAKKSSRPVPTGLSFVVDAGKVVAHLGERYPLPVEVVPFGHTPAIRALESLGARVILRRSPDGQPWVSDNGNYILDCHFGPILDPVALQKELLAIPAVVDSGLFLNMTDMAIVGQADGGVRLLQR
jgi:ribose 5-phosphate isomerase A